MKTQIITAIRILLVMTILTGIFYPFFITGVSQLIFPAKANGSLLIKDGKIAGSELIGQKFDSSVYFWSRPSAINYNPIPSAASNLGPTSDRLKKQVAERRVLFTEKNLITDTTAIPREMIFASGSGLDPHISPEAALMQINRIAKARNLNDLQKRQLINLVNSLAEYPQFGIFGENRINVLQLNHKTEALFVQ
jgi:potassium-transporting ATPase KdpC subunit